MKNDGMRALRIAAAIALACVFANAADWPTDGADVQRLAKLGGQTDKTPFRTAVEDFYLTNPIARASAVMAECSALAAGHRTLAAAE